LGIQYNDDYENELLKRLKKTNKEIKDIEGKEQKVKFELDNH
jgi:hypothetical protein